MKRSGFTMIELIFVIVILGILAAVAIPKLAATRDDAKIATKVQEATAVVSEIGAYYTAHGVFAKPVSDMTNVQLSDSATAENINGGTKDLNSTDIVYLTDGKGIGCVSYYAGPVTGAVAGSIDGNLTVKSLTGTSTICDAVRKALNDRNISSATGITHKFGGGNVTF